MSMYTYEAACWCCVQITMPEEDRRDDEKLYNKMTLASLQQIAPFVRKIQTNP
jgi:hypothetical protein